MVDSVTFKQGDRVILPDGQHGLVADVGRGVISVLRMDWPFPRPPKVYLTEQVTKFPTRYEGRIDPSPETHGEALF